MKSRHKIKAITIDLDDTLWSVWPVIREAEKVLFQWLCENAPKAAAHSSVETLSVLRKEVEEIYPQYQHNLSFYRQEAIRLLLKQHGENEALAKEGFEVFFKARQNVTLFEDSMLALLWLSKQYPIVAITNGNADLKAIGLHQFFKANISAQQVGVCKPNPSIFQEAMHILDINAPSHILHVGDDFERDVIGAKQVGFQTAWIQRPELKIPDVTPEQLKSADFVARDLIDLCQQLKDV